MSVPAGRVHRVALGVMLFAAVLSPVMGEALGWTTYPAPVAAAGVAVAAALAIVVLRGSTYGTAARAASVVVTLVVAAGFAAVLREQTNTFYTSTALFGGMVLLLFLHAAAVAMRRIVIRDDDAPRAIPVAALAPEHVVVAALEHLPPNEIRIVRAGRAALDLGPRSALWHDDPTVAVGDALANGAVWLLALFWGLAALEHRHVASVCLLLAGMLLAARCLALLPGVLATRADGGSAAA